MQRRLVILGLLVAMLGVGICGFAAKFVYLVDNQPVNIDPAKASDNPSMEFMMLVYEPLVFVDPATAGLIPVLATSWDSSADKKEWIFNLRPNVKFHDGTSFTAASVKETVERDMTIGQGESYVLGEVERVEVIDELTAKFYLRIPQPDFVFGLSRVFISSSEAVAAHEEGGDLAQGWFAENAVGTGAYELMTWDRGQQIIAEKFEDYWRGWEGRHVDQVILRCVPEPGTQYLMMERGEGHGATSIPLEDAVKLRDNPALRVEAYGGDPMYIVMNTNRGPLSNKLVRQAVAHAFDAALYREVVMEGFAKELAGPLPNHMWGALKDLKSVPFDLEKTKELLAKAGYPDGGFTLKFRYFQPFLFAQAAALMLQENLKEVGINMEIEGLPWAAFTAMVANLEARTELGMIAVFAGNPIPDILLRPMYHSNSEGHWAYWGYDNPTFNHVLDAATQELDDNVRCKLYEIAQEIIYYDYASIFVMQRPSILVFDDHVKGFNFSAYYATIPNTYWDLYLEE